MMNEQDRNEAAAIDARIARALRMLYARETRWREDPGTSLRVAEVCAALETAPREEAPASLSASEALFGFVGWITTRRERMVASATDDAAPWPALIEKFCECNALPMPREGWNRNLVHPREEAPDPLSPEAFRGRTTPNGLPVRWVAWDQEGVPFEYSTAAEPHRNAWGALHNNISSLNSRFDLLDPARAGQTLWVGEGPDPRTVQAPGAIAVPCAAPSTLPPLVGPDRPCLTWQDSAEHGSEWERIARAERAAREADIARLEREVSIRRGEVNDCLAQLRETHALRMQAEREREEARATAAQLAVERDALAEKWEAVVRIRRIFGGAS